jgi:dienelactone hydrolase
VVTITDVEYEADATTMIGRLAVPDGDGPHAAVLVGHEGAGLDDVQRKRAVRLAELGYAAFALDYHGGGRSIADPAEMMARLAEMHADPDRIEAIAAAGLDVLLSDPRTDAARVAAIGYCFGGAFVLELARGGADLRAVVGFHPRLSTNRPEGAANVTARVLVCLGSEDPLISVDERLAFEDEMRAAGTDWRMHVYGGAAHSFTHPLADQAALPGLAYHAPSAAHAWQSMLDLFGETLG